MPLREIARARGFRSLLYVPLMSKGTAIGVIAVSRRNPGSFSAHHVELLRTFADQAVIAIENVRLFNEVQAKTADLSGVAAAADRHRRRAQGDQPLGVRSADVLDTLVVSAARLCEADEGTIFQPRDDAYRLTASCGLSPPRKVFSRAARSSRARAAQSDGSCSKAKPFISKTLRPTQITDFKIRKCARGSVSLCCARAHPSACSCWHAVDVRPFSDKQIELVQTFADQAVIAIENARLFNETQETLERQTATADILKVIASSPTTCSRCSTR